MSRIAKYADKELRIKVEWLAKDLTRAELEIGGLRVQADALQHRLGALEAQVTELLKG
jgi:hypothetical protein